MSPRLPSRWSLPLLITAIGLLFGPACGRAHGLGIDTSSAGGGGSGATSGTGTGGATTTGTGTGGAGASGGATTTTSGSGTGGAGGEEPLGPTQLTIVNGVDDYPALKICFLPFPLGDVSAAPWPADPGGLPFAHARVVKPIADVIPPNADVRPHLIAGDLTQIAGKTCGEVLALAAMDPSPIVVSPLAVLPAAVFTSDKSLLLAPIGCMGGPGHDGPSAQLACGSTYTAATPNASIVALGMSRKSDPFHLSFQVVNASAALPTSDLQLRPGFEGSTDVLLATKVSTGQVAPKPPIMSLKLADLGPLDKVKVETFLPNQAQMFLTSSTPLAEAFTNGTVPMIDFEDGASVVLIGVGAYPGVDPGGVFHKLTFAMVKADP